mmetsp:Transcript_3910/g.11047  ORF Transcript_3910/g.11047 Transcript_3910/m.11047 type:complete len:223 (+) Transcript_3910:496-1164(+)
MVHVPGERRLLGEDLDGRLGAHKVHDGLGVVECVVLLCVPHSGCLSAGLGLERVRLLELGHVREDALGVEEARVDLGAGEAAAHHEDLGGLVAAGRRLRGLHLIKKLVEDPEQRVVVRGPEDLGHEPPAGREKLGTKLEGREGELGLAVGILEPRLTHVGGSIVEDTVHSHILELLAQHGAALVRGDVGRDCHAAGHSLDGHEIHTHDHARHGHVLASNLEP